MTKGYTSLLERFLVFLTVTSFILGVTVIIAPVLNNTDMGKNLINWFTYVVLVVSGGIFILIQQIFVHEKIKAYLHIVSCFFYVVLVVVLCWLLRQFDQPYVLIPFLIIQYFIENSLNNVFVYHDYFTDECGELNGKDLETHLFHNNLSAIDFGAKTRVAEGILVILTFLLFFILLALLKNGYAINITGLGLILLFFLGEALIFFNIGIFKNDVFFGFLGFRNYIQNKRKLLRSAAVIIFSAIIFGALLSSNHSFINLSFKDNPQKHVVRSTQSYSSYDIDDLLSISVLLQKMYPDNGKIPEWVFDLIFGIIQWGIIILLSIGIIKFFFQPFFSPKWKKFWKDGKLIKYLRSILSAIKNFFRYGFIKHSADEPYATAESRKFGEEIKDFLKKARRSKEKNEEIDRLTKHFMRLIDWGEAHEIKYRVNLAPAEYTALIVQKVETAEIKNAANTAGFLFEKALYDKAILYSDEEKRFIEAIKKVIQCE